MSGLMIHAFHTALSIPLLFLSATFGLICPFTPLSWRHTHAHTVLSCLCWGGLGSSFDLVGVACRRSNLRRITEVRSLSRLAAASCLHTLSVNGTVAAVSPGSARCRPVAATLPVDCNNMRIRPAPVATRERARIKQREKVRDGENEWQGSGEILASGRRQLQNQRPVDRKSQGRIKRKRQQEAEKNREKKSQREPHRGGNREKDTERDRRKRKREKSGHSSASVP